MIHRRGSLAAQVDIQIELVLDNIQTIILREDNMHKKLVINRRKKLILDPHCYLIAIIKHYRQLIGSNNW